MASTKAAAIWESMQQRSGASRQHLLPLKTSVDFQHETRSWRHAQRGSFAITELWQPFSDAAYMLNLFCTPYPWKCCVLGGWSEGSCDTPLTSLL